MLEKQTGRQFIWVSEVGVRWEWGHGGDWVLVYIIMSPVQCDSVTPLCEIWENGIRGDQNYTWGVANIRRDFYLLELILLETFTY